MNGNEQPDDRWQALATIATMRGDRARSCINQALAAGCTPDAEKHLLEALQDLDAIIEASLAATDRSTLS